jgi:hypothetical protein
MSSPRPSSGRSGRVTATRRGPFLADRRSRTTCDAPIHADEPAVGRREGDEVRARRSCDELGVEPVMLGPSDDLLQLAEDAVGRGCDLLGMAGGDAPRPGSPPPRPPTASRSSSSPPARATTSPWISASEPTSFTRCRRSSMASTSGSTLPRSTAGCS